MPLLNPRSHQHQKQKNLINPSGTQTRTLGPKSQHQLLKVQYILCFLTETGLNKLHSCFRGWIFQSPFVPVLQVKAGGGRGRARALKKITIQWRKWQNLPAEWVSVFICSIDVWRVKLVSGCCQWWVRGLTGIVSALWGLFDLHYIYTGFTIKTVCPWQAWKCQTVSALSA